MLNEKITWLWKEWVEDIIKLWKTKEFWKALKWEVSSADVVEDVSTAITKMKSEASDKFWKELDSILKQSDKKINFKNQIDNFINKLKEKWIKVSKSKQWNFTLKEWPDMEIIEEDLKVLKWVIKKINQKKWDLSWIWARALNNRIWAEASKLQNQWLLINLRKALTQEIEDINPWFKKMNKDYNKMKSTIKNLEDTFWSPKTRIETKINKLNMALRDNQDYKKLMLKIIEDTSWKNIKWTLSWLAAKEWLPRWLIWQIWAWWAAAAAVWWASIFTTLATLWLASPRLLWTVARWLWISVDKLKSFVNTVNKHIPKTISSIPLKEWARTWIKWAWTVWPVLENAE